MKIMYSVWIETEQFNQSGPNSAPREFVYLIYSSNCCQLGVKAPVSKKKNIQMIVLICRNAAGAWQCLAIRTQVNCVIFLVPIISYWTYGTAQFDSVEGLSSWSVRMNHSLCIQST